MQNVKSQKKIENRCKFLKIV